MHINPEVSMGNIITTVVTVVTVLLAYHRWDKKIEARHLTSEFRMESLESSVDAAKASIQAMQIFVGSLWKELIELKSKVK